MTIDRESLRPAFERWYAGQGVGPVGQMDEDGEYIDFTEAMQWDAWRAAFESLGEPVGRLEIREAVEVTGRSSATRIKTRFVNVYRLPEVKA